jgi:hypothetical protein
MFHHHHHHHLHYHHFSPRFFIWVDTPDILVFELSLFHTIWWSFIHFQLWLDNIPLCICTTLSLWLYWLLGTWLIPRLNSVILNSVAMHMCVQVSLLYADLPSFR